MVAIPSPVLDPGIRPSSGAALTAVDAMRSEVHHGPGTVVVRKTLQPKARETA